MLMRRFVFVVMCAALLVGVGLTVRAQETPTATPDPTLTVPEATPAATEPPASRPTPRQTVSGQRAVLDVLFERLPQGGVGVISVSGAGISGASARFLNRNIGFFEARGDGYWYALLTANIEQTARTYDVEVAVTFADGQTETLTAPIQVVSGGFISSAFTVPEDRLYLIDPEVERVEFARLAAVFDHVTEARGWDERGIQLPIASALTAPFGEVRVLNDTVQTRHTGWDLRATVGVPVQASAGGRVAFAGLLDIRGNYVVIDHGYGMFTGYAHLSQIHVTRGQTVTAGQIIGVTGDTGRSSGPHLHWEMNVNGDWVNVADVARMWLP
jgi:murein DD-endopeptidase MepM/ murein hydrolase activator NlpD